MFNYRLITLEACIVAFAGITVLMFNGDTSYFDAHWGAVIQGFREPWLNSLVEMITYIGNWQSITIICLLLLAFDKTRKKYGIPVTAVAILSTVFNKIAKMLIERPRPDTANMLIAQDGFSFPSGHTTTAIAVFFLLAYIFYKEIGDNKKKIPAMVGVVVLGLLISLSRIYLGVHWASDVFAGFFMGVGSFCLVALFFYRHKDVRAAHIARLKAKEEAKEAKYEELEVEVIEMGNKDEDSK